MNPEPFWLSGSRGGQSNPLARSGEKHAFHNRGIRFAVLPSQLVPMLRLISVVLVIWGALSLRRVIPPIRKHRQQVRFIRETLASSRKLDDRRVIASLSTVPEWIANLGPTIRSLLRQTRPPDEIVLAVPEFSIREQRPYEIPEEVSRWSPLRVLHCRKD